MGLRGPPPTPTAVLEARGSWRAKLNEGEMKPKSGAPKPPKGLKPEALAEWKRVVTLLAPTRVLTAADRSALIMYVTSWGYMNEASDAIARDGVVVTMPNGYPAANPYQRIYNEAFRQCERMLQQFGLTPSARARIPSPDAGDKGGGDLDF
jgi:P27 family predicted phage terminase small subunit